MKFPAYHVAVICLTLGAFSPCRADIVYYFDIPFPFDDGRVTGSIVTDGKLGYITANDIIDWDIVLTGGFPVAHTPLTAELQGPGSGSNSSVAWSFSDNAHPLSATATSLFWDFNEDADGAYFVFNGALGITFQASNVSDLCFGGCGPNGMFGGFPGVEYFQIVDQSNVSVAFGENDLGDYPIEASFPFEGPQLGLVAHRRRAQQNSRA